VEKMQDQAETAGCGGGAKEGRNKRMQACKSGYLSAEAFESGEQRYRVCSRMLVTKLR